MKLTRSEAERWKIVARRFGPGHAKPCRQPTVTTCAQWQCQVADECQHGRRALDTTNTGGGDA